jgi:homoserine kinase
VDRKVLADKLAAIIALARYRQATQEWREMLKRNVQFKVSEAFLKSLKQLSTLVRQVLQVDPDKVEMGSEAFPYRVELRETRYAYFASLVNNNIDFILPSTQRSPRRSVPSFVRHAKLLPRE